MAINRYQGNSGFVQRVAEQSAPPETAGGIQHSGAAGNFYRPRPAQPMQSIRPPRLQSSGSRGGLGFLDGLGSSLEQKFGGIFSRLTHLELETEDWILLLILYLMYRESKDEEILIIMGLLLFL